MCHLYFLSKQILNRLKDMYHACDWTNFLCACIHKQAYCDVLCNIQLKEPSFCGEFWTVEQPASRFKKIIGTSDNTHMFNSYTSEKLPHFLQITTDRNRVASLWKRGDRQLF